MFILGQLFTSGSRLFIAAIAVSVIVFGSIHFRFLMYSIVLLGIVSTIYTMAGGIKGCSTSTRYRSCWSSARD